MWDFVNIYKKVTETRTFSVHFSDLCITIILSQRSADNSLYICMTCTVNYGTKSYPVSWIYHMSSCRKRWQVISENRLHQSSILWQRLWKLIYVFFVFNKFTRISSKPFSLCQHGVLCAESQNMDAVNTFWMHIYTKYHQYSFLDVKCYN